MADLLRRISCALQGHPQVWVTRVQDCRGDVTRFFCNCGREVDPGFSYIWPDQVSTNGARQPYEFHPKGSGQ